MKKSIMVVLLGVVCFCVFYGIRYIENPAATQKAVLEVYENKIDTSGYIVRTEQVYNAPASGAIYHYVQEGTRVKKNRIISTVYTGNVSEQTLQELNNISSKLAELESTGAEQFTMTGTSGDGDIEGIKNNIVKACQSGDVSKISQYKSQINSIITGDTQSTQSDDVQTLKARKQQLEASIQSSKSDIYSQISGVFSKNIDGLEEVLTPKSVMSYKSEDFNALAENAKEYRTRAEKGQPVSKVVNNHSWYVLTTIEKETASEMKVGQKVKLRFGYLPGIEADAQMEYISTEDGESPKNVVVLKCEQYKEGVFSLRYSKIELILESYEGYRIPVSAIRINDGEKGVLVSNYGRQVFKKCNVIYTDTVGQTAIIAPVTGAKNMLRENDNIVVGEK